MLVWPSHMRPRLLVVVALAFLLTLCLALAPTSRGAPPGICPDPYEPNEDFQSAFEIPKGGAESWITQQTQYDFWLERVRNEGQGCGGIFGEGVCPRPRWDGHPSPA